jgi:hypothetical protein
LLRNLRIIVADLTASHITKQHFSYEQIKWSMIFENVLCTTAQIKYQKNEKLTFK